MASLFVAAATLTVHYAAAGAPSCRDKWLWPFSSDSIWNMPIGTDAVYVAAGIPQDLQQAHGVMADQEWFVITTNADEQVPWYDPQAWNFRCNGTKTRPAPAPASLHLPHDFVVPDCVGKDTPNNPAAFLQPDNSTLYQSNPIARCTPGGPLYGYLTPHEEQGQFEAIEGQGITGGHGGSGLSSLGGSIRLGEMLPGAPPIAHALKLELYAALYYYRNSTSGSCYRWPAVQCDSYAGSGPLAYNGTVPAVMPGSLLAVRPADFPTLNASLLTLPGMKLATALRDYGGYIVSDAAWDVRQICVQAGVEGEFLAAYGYNFTTTHGGGVSPWWQDVSLIFSYLFAVDNNVQGNVGGGGVPLQPLAPPFCDYNA